MTPQKPVHALPPIHQRLTCLDIASVENGRDSGSSNENPIDVEVQGKGLKHLFLKSAEGYVKALGKSSSQRLMQLTPMLVT